MMPGAQALADSMEQDEPLVPGGLNLVVMGPPLAGKSTQAQMLSDRYQLVAITIDELLMVRPVPTSCGVVNAAVIALVKPWHQPINKCLIFGQCFPANFITDNAQGAIMLLCLFCLSVVSVLQEAAQLPDSKVEASFADELFAKVIGLPAGQQDESYVQPHTQLQVTSCICKLQRLYFLNTCQQGELQAEGAFCMIVSIQFSCRHHSAFDVAFDLCPEARQLSLWQPALCGNDCQTPSP